MFSVDKYPGIPQVTIHNIKNEPFHINNVKIIPIEGLHYKLPVFGYRIKDFVYLTDISFISEKEKDKMRNADLIVLDALRQKPHISHFTLEQALALIEDLEPKQSLLTHISHYMGLHDKINKRLAQNINLAYDGQIIYLK